MKKLALALLSIVAITACSTDAEEHQACRDELLPALCTVMLGCEEDEGEFKLRETCEMKWRGWCNSLDDESVIGIGLCAEALNRMTCEDSLPEECEDIFTGN